MTNSDRTHQACFPLVRALWGLAPTLLALLLVGGCSSDSTLGRDLDGTWQTPCFQGVQTRLVYADLQLNGTFNEYSDMMCATPRHTTTWTGRAVVGDEVQPGVRKLNLAFDSFHSTPLTAAEAAFVNQNKYCGFTDWNAGVERDILGRDCFGFSIPVGGQSLDLYHVDGSRLLFGKSSKIVVTPTEADRPTELDPTRPFARI